MSDYYKETRYIGGAEIVIDKTFYSRGIELSTVSAEAKGKPRFWGVGVLGIGVMTPSGPAMKHHSFEFPIPGVGCVAEAFGKYQEVAEAAAKTEAEKLEADARNAQSAGVGRLTGLDGKPLN